MKLIQNCPNFASCNLASRAQQMWLQRDLNYLDMLTKTFWLIRLCVHFGPTLRTGQFWLTDYSLSVKAVVLNVSGPVWPLDGADWTISTVDLGESMVTLSFFIFSLCFRPHAPWPPAPPTPLFFKMLLLPLGLGVFANVSHFYPIRRCLILLAALCCHQATHSVEPLSSLGWCRRANVKEAGVRQL